MEYPRDPLSLASLSIEDWEALLDRLQRDPNPPHGIVRVDASLPFIRAYELAKTKERDRAAEKPGATCNHDRRNYILGLKEQGWKNAAIAKNLGVSPGLITKIIKGER